MVLKKIKNLFSSDNNNELQTASGHSIIGRKTNQEDSFFISERKENKQLIFVADGVGGHGHGEFASQTAVEIFQNSFIQNENFGDIPDFLRKTTLVVAAMVLQKGLEDPTYKNCGTTISGFFIDENKFYTFNVGDSRVYMYTKDKLLRKTKDHSKVQDLLDKGEITEDEAFTHPERNMMTSAIGQNLSMIKNDVNGPFEIEHGDILLAFSDGIHDALKDKAIEILIAKHKKNNELDKVLVDAAYNAGGKDNITACYYRHLI